MPKLEGHPVRVPRSKTGGDQPGDSMKVGLSGKLLLLVLGQDNTGVAHP